MKDLLSKKVQDTRLDLVEEGGAGETKESDLLLIMHLPLLECFFIVCAPRVGELQTAETAANSAAQTPAMTPAMTPRKTLERAESSGRPSLSSAVRSGDEPQAAAPQLQVSVPRASLFAPSSELQFYYDFASRHRRLLNVCCRQQPSLLKSVTGAFHSLVWHPAKILDFDIRRKYFKSEMKKLAMKQRQANPASSMASLRLYVRRESIFEDSYAQLERYAVQDWKNKLHVKFYGEEGLDAGGLSREWFLLLSREDLQPVLRAVQAGGQQPCGVSTQQVQLLEPGPPVVLQVRGPLRGQGPPRRTAPGRILRQAHADAHAGQGAQLPRPGERGHGVLQQPGVDAAEQHRGSAGRPDLQHGRATSSAAWRWSTSSPTAATCPSPTPTSWTFIHRITDFILTRSVQRQVDAFLQGFRELIPPALLIFNEHELELLLCGLPQIDLHDLQAHIEYRGYTVKDQTIQWFWQIAHDMSQQEKALLMLFVTGTSKIPLEGFKALQGANGINPFTIQKAEGVDTLPLAHTWYASSLTPPLPLMCSTLHLHLHLPSSLMVDCPLCFLERSFNTLDLPEYSSQDAMRSKVMYAIKEGSQGFGFR